MLAFSQETNQIKNINKYSYINDDNVNVRELPTKKSGIVKKINKDSKIVITGVSEKPESIDGTICYWLRINEVEKGKEIPVGWVFGKYIADGDQIKPSVISINNYYIVPYNYSIEIQISFTVNGQEVLDKVIGYFDPVQKFYTFSYTTDNFRKYDWHCIPGTYIFYPEKNEIKHIAYIGISSKEQRILLSSDYKYLIELEIPKDANVWFAKIIVWNILQNRIIYQSSYYLGEYDVRDTRKSNIIFISYEYFDYDWEHGDIDAELKTFAAKQRSLFGVKCQINLETMERRIVSAIPLSEN
jgi:hypothetical protein